MFDKLTDVVFVLNSDLKNQIVVLHVVVVVLTISFVGISGVGEGQIEHAIELPVNEETRLVIQVRVVSQGAVWLVTCKLPES